MFASKKITNRFGLSIVVSLFCLSLTHVADAAPTLDEDRGGDVSNTGSGSSKYTKGDFSLSSQGASRAEYRYPSVNKSRTWYSLKGDLKIENWNRESESGRDSNRICVIQALNVIADGEKTGKSNPINQLTVRKTTSTKDGDKLEWYVISGGGGSKCSGVSEPKENGTYAIELRMRKGSVPDYYIDGVRCRKAPADGDRPGNIGGNDSGKYFYAKLGAYVTGGSGADQDDYYGNGVLMEWRNIEDY